MNKAQIKRKKIFDAYSGQLHNLVEAGLYNVKLIYDQTYICPICFNQFSEKGLDTSEKIFLTLEDAPPKSLGGKSNTLTCSKCNNEAGHAIDFHLVERLSDMDVTSFLPNTGSRATVTHKGITVNGIVNVGDNGIITITHLETTNNPVNLKDYINTTGKDDLPYLEFPTSRVDFRKFEIALLKTAYILAFEKFGYSLILSNAFDIVREQIQNPSEQIYPEGFWTRQSIFNRSNEGVYFITTKEFEGFQAIFILDTGVQESGYGVYLPVSLKTTLEVIEKLKIQEPGFALSLVSYNHLDYLTDEKSQKQCADFMKMKNSYNTTL
ncbi:hypothetical protein [Flavobacterium sp.]|uniref:hypothetical protein n=1 Tax=Flavobacterium sp. TaxID=239 RepID=UPI0011F46325|nr:hypothetical protein [Flavobacterium sp.]RZJ71743.1 MAG: hypothetical protein EOO49_08755 [Flavobacterium sp.]